MFGKGISLTDYQNTLRQQQIDDLYTRRFEQLLVQGRNLYEAETKAQSKPEENKLLLLIED